MANGLSITAALEAAKQQQRQAERTVAVLQAAADVERMAADAPTQEETYRALKDRLIRETEEAQQKRDAAVAAQQQAVTEADAAIRALRAEAQRAATESVAELTAGRERLQAELAELEAARTAARTAQEAELAALTAETRAAEEKLARVRADMAALRERL